MESYTREPMSSWPWPVSKNKWGYYERNNSGIHDFLGGDLRGSDPLGLNLLSDMGVKHESGISKR